jgi:cytochrome c2
MRNEAAFGIPSWPGLSRPSTSCVQRKTWMRGTSPRMTVVFAVIASIAAATAAHAAGDAARGEQKFIECGACHSLKAGVTIVGPNLAGLFGRKAGSLTDFRYSPAMRRSGITWTAQTLDEFIADPQKSVPANRMPYAGLTGAGDRADLIAYLEQATK